MKLKQNSFKNCSETVL